MGLRPGTAGEDARDPRPTRISLLQRVFSERESFSLHAKTLWRRLGASLPRRVRSGFDFLCAISVSSVSLW